jgi:hypothetical protein
MLNIWSESFLTKKFARRIVMPGAVPMVAEAIISQEQ